MRKVRGCALDLSGSEWDPEHTVVVSDKKASNPRFPGIS
jgi:hypothetical protein